MELLIFLALMMGLIYFLMIRPQQRTMKAHQALLRALREGDMVVTSSGIHGAVAQVEDKVVWLEVAPEVELMVSKSAIAERLGDESADAGDDDDHGDDDSDDQDVS